MSMWRSPARRDRLFVLVCGLTASWALSSFPGAAVLFLMPGFEGATLWQILGDFWPNTAVFVISTAALAVSLRRFRKMGLDVAQSCGGQWTVHGFWSVVAVVSMAGTASAVAVISTRWCPQDPCLWAIGSSLPGVIGGLAYILLGRLSA